MIKFRHRKIDNHFYTVYMVQMQIVNNEPKTNVIDIPGSKHSFCTYSKEIAQKTCNLLKSVTNCQDLQKWDRSTLKRVQQIVRLMYRISFPSNIYPIPFEELKTVLNWEIAAWAVTETYKKQIATYKLGYNEAKRYSSKSHIQENLLEDLTHWVTDPNNLIYDSKKGEYEQNPYNSQNNTPLFYDL